MEDRADTNGDREHDHNGRSYSPPRSRSPSPSSSHAFIGGRAARGDKEERRQDPADIDPQRIYIGNLRSPLSESDISSVFSSYGSILKISYRQDKPYMAFIQYENAEAARSAMEALHNREHQLAAAPRQLIVRYAENRPPVHDVRRDSGRYGAAYRRLYIAMLHKNTSVENLQRVMEKYGEILEIVTFPSGFGFVSYSSPSSAAAAVRELNGTQGILSEEKLQVRPAEDQRIRSGKADEPHHPPPPPPSRRSRSRSRSRHRHHDRSRSRSPHAHQHAKRSRSRSRSQRPTRSTARLFLSGLSRHVDDKSFQRHMEKYGSLSECYLGKDGVAFVTYEHKSDGDYAIKKLHRSRGILSSRDADLLVELAEHQTPKSWLKKSSSSPVRRGEWSRETSNVPASRSRSRSRNREHTRGGDRPSIDPPAAIDANSDVPHRLYVAGLDSMIPAQAVMREFEQFGMVIEAVFFETREKPG